MEDALEEIRQFMIDNRDRVPVWTIYDHPEGFPDVYMARLWLSLPEPVVLTTAMQCADLKPLQDRMELLGLTRIARLDQDHPDILETWL